MRNPASGVLPSVPRLSFLCLQESDSLDLEKSKQSKRCGFGSIIPVDRSSLSLSQADTGVVSGECQLTASHQFLVSTFHSRITNRTVKCRCIITTTLKRRGLIDTSLPFLPLN